MISSSLVSGVIGSYVELGKLNDEIADKVMT
jgi:hypothetical protein